MEVAMLARWIVRRLGLDGNPLRRRTDRVETWLTVAMTAALLVTGPFVVWKAGTAAHRSTVSAIERDNRQPRFRLHAVLLADVVDSRDAGELVRPQYEPVAASWTAPDGTPRTGQVVPQFPADAGTAILIWTNGRGELTRPPHPHNPTGAALKAGLGAAVGLVTGVACLLLLIRRRLDMRRMASWQIEWIFVEPRWSGRR